MNADIHTLTGAYAAHALPDDERLLFERHLAECASCRAEVAELQATLALLGVAAAASPPPELRGRVMAEVDTLRQLPPAPQAQEPPVTPTEPDTDAATRPPHRHRGSTPTAARWARAAVGLAAVLVAALAISVAVVVHDYRQQTSDSRAQLDRVAGVLSAPDARVVRADVTGPGQGNVVVSARRNQAAVVLDGMAPAPAGRTYQLWLIDANGPTSAGLLAPDRGKVATVVPADVSSVRGVGITVEPRGGSRQPTTRPVVFADLGSPTG